MAAEGTLSFDTGAAGTLVMLYSLNRKISF
jgi:hypothetical protein